jgi:hypothetical protein
LGISPREFGDIPERPAGDAVESPQQPQKTALTAIQIAQRRRNPGSPGARDLDNGFAHPTSAKKMLKNQNLKSKGLTRRDLKEISSESQDFSEINLRDLRANLKGVLRFPEINLKIALRFRRADLFGLAKGRRKMRKNQKEVHEVHWTFCFMSLGGELPTFPHVHDVHEVHC